MEQDRASLEKHFKVQYLLKQNELLRKRRVAERQKQAQEMLLARYRNNLAELEKQRERVRREQ